MIRSIGAIATGYVIFAASAVLLFQLSGVDPHAPASAGFKIGSIVCGIVFALVAGWLTGRVAAQREGTHAAILAVVIALGALVSLLASRSGSIWSQVAALVFMAPAAWVGGVLGGRGSAIGDREPETGRGSGPEFQSQPPISGRGSPTSRSGNETRP